MKRGRGENPPKGAAGGYPCNGALPLAAPRLKQKDLTSIRLSTIVCPASKAPVFRVVSIQDKSPLQKESPLTRGPLLLDFSYNKLES